MLDFFIASLWFFLPAGLANGGASVFRFIPLLNVPLDFGRTYKGKPIFGQNKTWRGLIIGTLLAIGLVYLQVEIYSSTSRYCLIDYRDVNPILLGSLFGFGALIADAIESFFKRQKDIPPGTSWIPFDQIDWIIGGLLLSSIYVEIPLMADVVILFTYAIIHPVANTIAFYLRMQKNKL